MIFLMFRFASYLLMQEFQNITQKAVLYLSQADQYTTQFVYSRVPRVANLSKFEQFLLINIIVIFAFLIISTIRKISPKIIVHKFVNIIFKAFYARSIPQKLEQMKHDITKSVPEYGKSKLTTIPYKTPDEKIPNNSEVQSLKGFLSGSRYPLKQHSDFVSNLAKYFAYSNPLHFDIHPYVKQMQVEAIKMCGKMLNFGEDGKSYGAFTTGGTESIFLAILAYREYGLKQRGIRNPNLVISQSGHAAALKACDYLDVEIRIVDQTKNYEMDIGSMKRNIDDNTIAVYTSYPNYPYGTVDPIHNIAKICKNKNVPVHLDMCLGGFLVPFLKNKEGQPMLRVPKGVTSISLDPHKYGLAAKGASIILYSDPEILRQQFFISKHWPGGLYGTPTISGSRSGAPIASTWISMMKMGVNGYTQNAQNVQNATLRFAAELKKLGFQVMGNPEICVIAFRHPRYSVNNIQIEMKKREWQLALNQNPLCIHFSFTPLNSQNIDKMIRDIQEVCAQMKNLPDHKNSETMELYGACAKIPDGPTKELVIYKILQAYNDI